MGIAPQNLGDRADLGVAVNAQLSPSEGAAPIAPSVADLCDAFADQVQVAEPIFRDFGGRISFFGTIRTIKAYEDNSLVRTALDEPGNGQVLVVDGGGSLRCAMLGDQLADLAVRNGWAGVVVYGCVRDSACLATLPLGVKGLGTHPLKSVKRNEGQRDIAVRFAGVTFYPNHLLYADGDGLIVAEKLLQK